MNLPMPAPNVAGNRRLGLSRPRSCLCAWGAIAALMGGAHAAAPSPLSPEEAWRAFETEPGLRVELAAAEPVTVAPCAMAWDERMRLFVAENRGDATGGPAGAGV